MVNELAVIESTALADLNCEECGADINFGDTCYVEPYKAKKPEDIELRTKVYCEECYAQA